MKKTFVFFIGVLLGLGYIAWRFILISYPDPIVQVNGHKLHVYIARTIQEKEKGLSGHARLHENQGMLFMFDHADIYSFWMPDMKFPIDIIWIRKNIVQEITTLGIPEKDTPIPRYTPIEKADMVLEIDAGLAQKYTIVKGTSITIKNIQ